MAQGMHRICPRSLVAVAFVVAGVLASGACGKPGDGGFGGGGSVPAGSGGVGSVTGSVTGSSSVAGTPSGATVVHVDVAPQGDVHGPFAGTSPPKTRDPVPSGTVAAGGASRSAQSFAGVPTVGRLYLVVDHVAVIPICTASVVHSASGDLIMTAAHCVQGGLLPGYHDSLAFVPGYHDGLAPYGVWEATGAFLDSRWVASGNTDADAAFLTVSRVGSGTGTLESVTGANKMRIDPPYTDTVTVIAYPMTAQKPIACAAATSEYSATQLRFACGGFADGSSGGPFLDAMDPATGVGTVIGVVGGYQQGGDTPDISFAARPGAALAALYRAAGGV